jgi:signal transduction histidine kinase
MQPLNLRETIDAAVAQRIPDAEAKQITITNDTPFVMINQHGALFSFVIDSLIDNAIKFTDVGGTISIEAKPSKQQISVNIVDTGVGIPSEKQSQLFKPFSRTESAVDFNYEGLGFSLFLDKIIMDYLGGDISVASQQRAGSTFTITSNLYAQAAENAANQSSVSQMAATPQAAMASSTIGST